MLRCFFIYFGSVPHGQPQIARRLHDIAVRRDGLELARHLGQRHGDDLIVLHRNHVAELPVAD